MEKCFFSIVVPAYGRLDLLRRALSSIAEQSFDNYEVIVVDDCSPEDVYGVVESLNIENIKYYKMFKNSGGGEARNKGIDLASGRYVAFLDSDDYWYSNRLDVLYNVIENNGSVDLIVSGSDIKKKNGTAASKLRGVDFSSGIFDAIILNGALVQTSALVVRRDLFPLLKFDSSLRKHQDLDLYVKADSLGIRPLVIPDSLGVWDISHDYNSISRTNKYNQSIEWIKSVRGQVSLNAYCMFSARFILAVVPSVDDFLKSAVVLFRDLGVFRKAYFFIAAACFYAVKNLKGRIGG